VGEDDLHPVDLASVELDAGLDPVARQVGMHRVLALPDAPTSSTRDTTRRDTVGDGALGAVSAPPSVPGFDSTPARSSCADNARHPS
jgi:hypothetical protein